MFFKPRSTLPPKVLQKAALHQIQIIKVNELPFGEPFFPSLLPRGNGEDGYMKALLVKSPFDSKKLDQYLFDTIYFFEGDPIPKPPPLNIENDRIQMLDTYKVIYGDEERIK